MVQPRLTRSLGLLTIGAAATKSDDILALALEKFESIQIAAPASIGAATAITVESLDKVGGSAWGNHLSGGTAIVLVATERVTLTDLPQAGLRLSADIAPGGGGITFEITGKLSQQGLAREGISFGPAT